MRGLYCLRRKYSVEDKPFYFPLWALPKSQPEELGLKRGERPSPSPGGSSLLPSWFPFQESSWARCPTYQALLLPCLLGRFYLFSEGATQLKLVKGENVQVLELNSLGQVSLLPVNY